jgi:hypothetical protein
MTVRENEMLADALMTDRDSLIKYISQGSALDAALHQANTDVIRLSNEIVTLNNRIDDLEKGAPIEVVQ